MSAQGQGMRQRSQGSHKPRPIREPNAPRSPAAQSSDSSGSSPPLDPQRSTCGSSLMPTKGVSQSVGSSTKYFTRLFEGAILLMRWFEPLK